MRNDITCPRFHKKFNETIDVLNEEEKRPGYAFSVLALAFMEIVRKQAKANRKSVRELMSHLADIEEDMEKDGLI